MANYLVNIGEESLDVGPYIWAPEALFDMLYRNAGEEYEGNRETSVTASKDTINRIWLRMQNSPNFLDERGRMIIFLNGGNIVFKKDKTDPSIYHVYRNTY